MRNRFALAAAAMATAIIAAPQAEASVVLNITQSGADVVGAYSGSFDYTGITPIAGFTNLGPKIVGNAALFASTVNPLTGFAVTGPTSWGSGGLVNGTSAIGDTIYVYGGRVDGSFVYFNTSYVAGAALSGSVTFANQTLASLGLTPGTYLYSGGSDTVTVNIGEPVDGAVPEPATWLTMILGFGMIGGAMRRRQRQTVRHHFA